MTTLGRVGYHTSPSCQNNDNQTLKDGSRSYIWDVVVYAITDILQITDDVQHNIGVLSQLLSQISRHSLTLNPEFLLETPSGCKEVA